MADKLPEDFDYPSEVYDNWISDIVQDANFISNVYKQPLYSKILKAFIDGIPEYCNESFYVPTRSEDNYNYFGLFNLVDIFMEGTSERSNRKFKRQLDSLLETYPDTNTPDAAALAQEIIRLWDSQT
jgi:hypothetical protein